MRKFKFAKLVRDKIVKGIQEAGNKPVYHILSQAEYIEELKKKVLEEAMEVPKAHDKKELLKEIADVQEVIDNLVVALDSSTDEIAEIQARKNDKAGSFKEKHYIDYVEAEDNSEWVEHYLASAEKYPELKD